MSCGDVNLTSRVNFSVTVTRHFQFQLCTHLTRFQCWQALAQTTPEFTFAESHGSRAGASSHW